MIRWVPARALHGDNPDRERAIARLTPNASMTAGDWNSPLALVLLGAVLVVVGVVLARLVRAARARRHRDSR